MSEGGWLSQKDKQLVGKIWINERRWFDFCRRIISSAEDMDKRTKVVCIERGRRTWKK